MDEARLQAFMGRLVSDMGAAAILANVILGDELGLYKAMAGSQPVTPSGGAQVDDCGKAGLRERTSLRPGRTRSAG